MKVSSQCYPFQGEWHLILQELIIAKSDETHVSVNIMRILSIIALLEKLLSVPKTAPTLSYKFGAETFTHFSEMCIHFNI